MSTETITHQAPESHKIHSGGMAHEHLPVRPCADTPVWHLRTNNPLALQAAFQCGTVHHACQGVNLRKISDNNPIFNPGRVSGSYVGKINRYLRQWSGPLTRQIEDDLRKNDLRGLSNLLYLHANDPTPGQ